MKELRFRDLTASEVECRVSTVRDTGVQLLIYKDARVDMNVLDETVGAANWEKDAEVINGNLYGIIRIWDPDKGQWITKKACGVESKTEKEKGEDSDALKRAGFAWGIGRELYTSPFIWINSEHCELVKGNNGLICKTYFSVSEMTVENKTITHLVITNKDTGEVVYSFDAHEGGDAKNEPKQEKSAKPKTEVKVISDAQKKTIESMYSAGQIEKMMKNPKLAYAKGNLANIKVSDASNMIQAGKAKASKAVQAQA